jgi:hypothetical protein
MIYRKSRTRRVLTLLLILIIVGGSGVLIGTYLIAPVPRPAVSVQSDGAGEVPAPAEATTSSPREDTLNQQWGIEASTVRLVAGGNVLDFRYKIVDVGRAAKLAQPEYEAHLLLQSENKLNSVNPKRSGPLLEGKQKLRGGEYRSLFFGNANQRVKTGDLVTVVIGRYRAENLQVQ